MTSEEYKIEAASREYDVSRVGDNGSYDALACITNGMKIEVYWQDDDKYYLGTVTNHRPNNEQAHMCTINYDDGDIETVDLSKERFRIIAYLVGNRIPDDTAADARCIFNISEEEYEVYLPVHKEWMPIRSNLDKMKLFRCSFETHFIEVELENDGLIYITEFRKVKSNMRARKKKAIFTPPINDATSKKQRSTIKSPPKKLTPKTGAVSKEVPSKHCILDELKMSRKELLCTLPKDMKSKFNALGWAYWKGIHRPVLILSIFDLDKGGIAEKWVSTYQEFQRRVKEMSKFPWTVYWYEKGWSFNDKNDFKAFSLMNKNSITTYEMGVKRGWDNPFSGKSALTEEEDSIIRGIRQMKQDVALPGDCRGGPMFFPELKAEQKGVYEEERVMPLEERYNSWKESDQGYKSCTHHENITVKEEQMSSLELCAGTAILSKSLKALGFNTVTLDHDTKWSATSELSLEQLERLIIDGGIRDHPHLNTRFDVLWGSPECRTWSRASSSRYRSTHFIDGFGNTALEKDALQARKDIETLVNIISFYKKEHPELLIAIENPVGFLQHHPVSGLFSDVLGLEMVQVSYCQFSTETSTYPQKDTLFWTNSEFLIHQFGDEGKKDFRCQRQNCKHVGEDGKHTIQVQDLSNKCSAYPESMSKFIAGMLYTEALKRTFAGNMKAH